MSDTPQEVPLPELLKHIPKVQRLTVAFQWDESGNETGHHIIPIGRYAHEAADRIEQLERENNELSAEITEQARLLSMGSEREARLMAQLAEAQAALTTARQEGADAARREAAGILQSIRDYWVDDGRYFTVRKMTFRTCEKIIVDRIGQPVGEHQPTNARVEELDRANTGLAEEVRILRHRLEDLIDAFDATADLDEMDGPEYAEASAKLQDAIAKARPHTEAAILASLEDRGGEDKSTKAWADVPNASQWVDELRGGEEGGKG